MNSAHSFTFADNAAGKINRYQVDDDDDDDEI